MDYRPFWNIQAPPGFNFTGTVYPASAPIQPSTWGGWTLSPTVPDSAISVTGFYGKIRIYLYQRYSTAGTQIPFVVKWLAANSTKPVSPLI